MGSGGLLDNLVAGSETGIKDTRQCHRKPPPRAPKEKVACEWVTCGSNPEPLGILSPTK